MNKKLIGGGAIALAVVCASGGYVAIQREKETQRINAQITKDLEQLENITVTEGEALPDLKRNLNNAEYIDPNSVNVDIQNVDITVPGTYDISYDFTDIQGNSRTKNITCTVTANLPDHVQGMTDLKTELGKELEEPDVTYDEYIDSVICDTSSVDINEAGTYPLTYSILGIDGSMENVDYLATVIDTAPEPEEEVVEDVPQVTEAPVESGNVEVVEKDHTVQTADNTNIAGIMLAFATGVGALFAGLKKKFEK